MMNAINLKTLIFVSGLLLTSLAQAASFTASVDRNKIAIRDVLALQLRYTEQVDADQLDLSAIKADFDILGLRPQSSSSMSWVNGKSTREELTIWNVTLAPKREGTLVIPSFNLNGDVSNAIRIDVVSTPASVRQDQPMVVRLTTDTNNAYIGQQIVIKVELLAQNSVSNLSGDQLRLDGAEVELLDQTSFRKIENGISWQVVEWSYAVFPEKAGILAIPAQLFSGAILAPQQRNSFDPFRQQRGQRISARSSATSLEILDVPETNGLPWFPANDVRIESSWSDDTSQMRVGEPITRIIQIISDGQRASVIPPLPENSSITYKAYKDQPQLENQPSASGILGIRQESEAIVPSSSGLLELPEQRIAWWSTVSNSWQDAILPAETFEVLPAVKTSSFTPPSGSAQFLPDQMGESLITAEATNPWWKIATAVLALICLIQAALLYFRKPAQAESDSGPQQTSELKAWKELQKALRSGDPKTIRDKVLHWAQQVLPDKKVSNLQTLAAFSDDLEIQLGKLDESLYKAEAALDIDSLSKAIQHLKNDLDAKPQQKAGLSPLYPV